MKPRLLALVVAAVSAVLLCAGDASAQFDTPNRSFHNATAFRLDGKHQAVACQACHLNGQFRGTPTACYDCHWVRRKDDRYQTRLGTQCEQCHRPTSWTAVNWNHAGQAGVPLNADHRQIACESCHRDGNFRSASVVCASCHQKDYSATRAPNHQAAGFPMACEGCHRPSDATWRNTGGAGAFNHNAVFALVGTHATLACASCHKNNVYKGTPRECVGCHQNDYNRTQNPNHAAAGFPTSCDGCHRPTDPSFRGSGATQTFNHNLVFPLVGVHATQACAVCHKNNTYRGTRRDCVGCHQENYNRTQSPSHIAAGMPTTCETCHRPTDPTWASGATFNHNSVFALAGVHASQACTACHVNNVYKGTSRTCVGCHQTRYNATTNPPHGSAGFSTTCETCHKPTDPTWNQGVFNHGTVFALVGVHATQACAACHKNNVYKGTSRTCVGCHLARYNATTNPPHASSGFPTTCETCHKPTDSTWAQGTFTHTWFRIPHHGFSRCADCHTTPNNTAAFSCTVCHTRAKTDSQHQGRAGYVYDSNACYSCHR